MGWGWRSEIELVLGRLTGSGSEAEDSFRFEPAAGEAAREVGGDGGKVGGRVEAKSPIIYNGDEDKQID